MGFGFCRVWHGKQRIQTTRRRSRVSEASRHNRLSPPQHPVRIKAPLVQEARSTVPKSSPVAKRRFTRVALPKGMLIPWQYSAGRSVSRVSTLGLGGLFIATSDPPPVGALLKVVFDVPGGEVRARVIVKNIKPGHGMAVAFVQMEQEDRARLDQLLKKLA